MRETSTGETAAFVSNVVLDGAVENWLVELEHAMKKSMQQLLAVSIQACLLYTSPSPRDRG